MGHMNSNDADAGNIENDEQIFRRRASIARWLRREKKVTDVKQVQQPALIEGIDLAPDNNIKSIAPTVEDLLKLETINNNKAEPEVTESEVAEPKAAEPKVAEPEVTDEKETSSPLNESQYCVNYEHVKIPIAELTHSMEVTNEHSALQLIKILESVEENSDEYTTWKSSFPGNIGSKSSAVAKLKSVVEYAENNSNCTPIVKQRLRIVTKLILESKNQLEFLGIICLLASHGQVCHVMKEVAINNAYSMMTGNLAEYVKSQTLKEHLLRSFREYRVLLIEEMFHAFGFSNNTHYVAGFHNTLAEDVGVEPYNDPNICYPSNSKHPNWRLHVSQRYFALHYTKEKMIQWILTQIDEKKIGYQKIVTWFEQNKPKDMSKFDMLSSAINIETGAFDKEWICWMLEKMEIFSIKGEDWKPIEKLWE